MGAKMLQSDAMEHSKIDLSPMIDCVFILLIFFIVTTVFVDEVGIRVNKPDIDPTGSIVDSANRIELVVTAKGTVIYHRREVDLQAIPQLIKQLLNGDMKTPVLISAEDGVRQELFAKVYGDVVAGGAQLVSFK